MATLTVADFGPLAVEATRQANGKFWRLVRPGMWTTRGAIPWATPAPAAPEPLPASVAPMAVSMAAAVTLGGLGWIIYRRNLLAGTEDVSTDWVKAAAEWLSWLFRALATLPRRSRSGVRSLGSHPVAPRRQVALDPSMDPSRDEAERPPEGAEGEPPYPTEQEIGDCETGQPTDHGSPP